MAKAYDVQIETRGSVVVYEFYTPITIGRLSNIINNNYYKSSEIVSINVYNSTVAEIY